MRCYTAQLCLSCRSSHSLHFSFCCQDFLILPSAFILFRSVFPWFLFLLTAFWLRAISSSLHLLVMLSGHHLLLMMLSIHLLLTMHHLLIHRMLVMTSPVVPDTFVVHPGLVSFSVVIVAVEILFFVPVPLFFMAHSCSLFMTFADITRLVLTFSGSSFASSANALSALSVLLVE